MKNKYISPEISVVEMENDLMDVFAQSNGLAAVNYTLDDPTEEYVENDPETTPSSFYTPAYQGWGNGNNIE